MESEQFFVAHDRTISLEEYDPAFVGNYSKKKHRKKKLKGDLPRLAELQDVLYAHDTYALLLVFQAMDAAGKDGVIKHVMSGVNPQGCQVFSFKAPSAEELDHDYLWRNMTRLPERGRIGIFNRSYYEEVLVVRVHPELLARQKLPPYSPEQIWEQRFGEINNFEHYLVSNGVIVLKFFLHLSKDEQRRRFIRRIDRPDKNWKFSAADIRERGYWDAYMHAYEEMINHTSTEHAPWYVIPADNKWYTRGAVAGIIIETLESLDLRYPVVSDDHRMQLQQYREQLEQEE